MDLLPDIPPSGRAPRQSRPATKLRSAALLPKHLFEPYGEPSDVQL
jgi:hypothetical protein